ncbi:N-acetylmuramoyl-L-alanine amidase [Paenibacillus sp. GP183]|uniref:N-acetylmuramoyl-L-alanine amidase family protein n=1 Tax=Paenibacillus sp. GP183 TaxID=1882751 RepID=UPI0008971833|nr:N-acetylmuramoyl-L-alanine amidase [Paenibacillus sp. GP183]SEB57492.1 N-acetylmuramoyl-L-alanine amidase [Paenibacillus sp. GP183]
MIKKTTFLSFFLFLIFLQSDISRSTKAPQIYFNGAKVNAEESPKGNTCVPKQNVEKKQITIELVGDSHPLYKIVIDPGHGGADVGTVGISGRLEKDFTLSTALKVKRLMDLEPAVTVYLTRTDDTFIPLNDRIIMANQLSADLYLSIHANMVRNSMTKGTETFFYRESSMFFAQIVHKHVLKATGFPDLHVDYENFRVIKNTIMPAALVEVGFLSNAAEEKALFMSNNQDKIAAAMMDGIKEYLGIK